jgi:hypothetical protein
MCSIVHVVSIIVMAEIHRGCRGPAIANQLAIAACTSPLLASATSKIS